MDAHIDVNFLGRDIRFVGRAGHPVIQLFVWTDTPNGPTLGSRLGHVAHASSPAPEFWVSPNHYDWLGDRSQQGRLRDSAVRWWRSLAGPGGAPE